MALLTAQMGLKGDGLQFVLSQELENVLRTKYAATLGANLINRITAGNLTTTVSEDSFSKPGLAGWNSMDNITLTGKQTYSVDTYTKDQVVVFDLLSAWNTVKNIYLTSDKSEQLRLDGFVHVDVYVGQTSGYNSYIDIIGAKRGNVVTGAGADRVQIATLTNDGNFSNDFRIGSGDGNDSISVGGMGHTPNSEGAVDDATYDNLPLDNTGKFTNVYADLGNGNDQFVDTSLAEDKVWGGAGSDRIVAGGGNDWIDGGTGNDQLYGGLGSDRFVFKGDFGRDMIYDAWAGREKDSMEFSKSVFTSVQDVLDHARQDGFNTVIEFDANGDGVLESITLFKEKVTDLSSHFDFFFT